MVQLDTACPGFVLHSRDYPLRVGSMDSCIMFEAATTQLEHTTLLCVCLPHDFYLADAFTQGSLQAICDRLLI